jgi:hypothetical protein
MWITYSVSLWGAPFLTDDLQVRDEIAETPYASDSYWMVPGTVDPNDD